MKEKKFTTRNLVLVVLVLGIVLVGFGMFGKLAVGVDLSGPQEPIGDPGANLSLDNFISYAQATKPCEGTCPLEIGQPVSLGRYIGGYLISFRSCPKYSCGTAGDGNDYCWCNSPTASDPSKRYFGDFASGFGILILRSSPNQKKPAILLPLEVEDIPGGDSLPDPIPDYDGLLWVQFNLTNYVDPSPTTGGNYEYQFDGLIGGCVDGNDDCGRVFLEHTIGVTERTYGASDPIGEN